MSEQAKPTSFFIQDPFTEEVKGPLSVQQLKQWFAQGSVGDWGVSKSANGPWTPASQVKGLQPAVAPPPVAVAPKDTPSAVAAALPGKESSKTRGSKILDFETPYFDATVAKRFGIPIISGVFLLGCGYVLGRVQSSPSVKVAQPRQQEDRQIASNDNVVKKPSEPNKIDISDRFRKKFQDLYDQVKGGAAKISQMQRRDMPRFAEDMKSQVALLPSSDSEDLTRVGGKLKAAANALARAAELFVTQGEAEVALSTSGQPGRVGGMSVETENMFRAVVNGSKEQIVFNLKAAKDNLTAVESDPIFDDLMK